MGDIDKVLQTFGSSVSSKYLGNFFYLPYLKQFPTYVETVSMKVFIPGLLIFM